MIDDIGKVRKQIDAVDEALNSAVISASTSIGGRTITRQQIADLESRRNVLVRRLKTLEAAAAGLQSPGIVQATWR